MLISKPVLMTSGYLLKRRTERAEQGLHAPFRIDCDCES